MKKSKVFLSLAALFLAFFLMPQTVHAAGFVQDAAGVKYQNDDGSYMKDSWVQVGQSIYHLDANGYVQFGWIQVGSLWYNMGADGICQNPNGSAAPDNSAAVSAASASASVTAANSASAASSASAAATSASANNIFAAAGWVPFVTADANVLQTGIATGFIGFDGAQYWAEPTYAAAVASLQTGASASQQANIAAAQQTAAAAEAVPTTVTYVINTNTRKFHRPSCSSVPTIKSYNRKDSGLTLEQIKAQGYAPCKRCLKGY